MPGRKHGPETNQGGNSIRFLIRPSSVLNIESLTCESPAARPSLVASRMHQPPTQKKSRAVKERKRQKSISVAMNMKRFPPLRVRKRQKKKNLQPPPPTLRIHQNSVDNIFDESEYNHLGGQERTVHIVDLLCMSIAFYFKGYYLIRFSDLAPLFPSFDSLSACLLRNRSR